MCPPTFRSLVVRPKEDETSGCEVCPDARNALSCGGGAVEEDATSGCEVSAESFCFRRSFGPWLNLAKCTWDVTYCYRTHNLCEHMLTPEVGLGDVPLGQILCCQQNMYCKTQL